MGSNPAEVDSFFHKVKVPSTISPGGSEFGNFQARYRISSLKGSNFYSEYSHLNKCLSFYLVLSSGAGVNIRHSNSCAK